MFLAMRAVSIGCENDDETPCDVDIGRTIDTGGGNVVFRRHLGEKSSSTDNLAMNSEAATAISPRASDKPYLQRQACPLCAAPADKSTKTVVSPHAAENLLPSQLGPLLQGYESNRAFFSYHECHQCGVLYCPVFFDQEQLDVLYSRQPENIAEAPVAARAKTQASYFHILRQYSPLSGNYLEIGCDIGLFTELSAREGHLQKLWLYEPNLTVHDQLKEKLAGQSYSIRTDSFGRGHVPAGSLSTVVAIHVVDHLLEPRRLLEELRESLAPCGIVFVVVHDCESTLARMMGDRWPPYALQHPQLFSARSLRAMLSATGFETLALVKTYNFFPLAFLARGALQAFGVTIPKALNFSWPMVGLRLGNIAAVGRKS